jgi:UDP-N-acetylmuramyl tripeptide synthase
MKESKGSKPDFLDLDKDGDKKEPMKKAAKEKNMKKEEVQQMDEFVASAMGALNTANKIANVANTGLAVANTIKNTMKKKKQEDEMEEAAVAEHHQKDADGKVIEHEDTTPSSVEEKTVLEQLIENGREIDAFEAVISYLIDEGFAKSWEEAQDIMVTLKPELVEEVYQNQLKKI